MAISRRPRPLRILASAVTVFGLLPFVLTPTAGCGDTNAAIERLSEARHLSADLYVQFMKASGSTDRAVMADTDQASSAFARESEAASQAIQHDIDTLGPMLPALGYTEEARLFDAFVGRFATYRELDERILDLAVQNTNLKAQQLSFGPGQEAADAVQAALDASVAARPAEAWQARALAATVAAVRQIQALQAPHIADADDAIMTRLEGRMQASEAEARRAVAALRRIAAPASAARLDAATAALDRLMAVNAQLIGLSRQNTNVRSLALALESEADADHRVRGKRARVARRAGEAWVSRGAVEQL